MELHYKCTMWCKLIFSDETDKKDLIQKLNEGYLPLELGYNESVEGVNNTEWIPINDTEEFISVEENDNQSTIKLYDNISKAPIWDNSYESEIKRRLSRKN